MLNNFIPIQNSFPTSSSKPTNYTIANAKKVSSNIKTNIIPKLGYYPIFSGQNKIYNFMPLKTVYGESVKWNGNYIAIVDMQPISASLGTTDKQTHYNNRKKESTLCFLYSSDGLNWKQGSNFYQYVNSSSNYNTNANYVDLQYQWSGTAVLREGTTNIIDVFYGYCDVNLDKLNETSTYPYGPTSVSNYSINHVSGTLNSDLSISMNKPKILFKPDDINYSSWWMNNNCSFKDPYVFVNPYDGYVYCLVSANIAFGNGTIQIKDEHRGVLPPGYVEKSATDKTAVIGLSRFGGDSFDNGTWTNLPPLLSLCGVASETSKPVIIFKNGYTYIFFGLNSETSNTPTGLFGFYSEDGLFGDYHPLNGDGQVLTNPSTYSEQIFNFVIDDDLNVYSIIKDSYSLTPAPTTKIILDKSNAYVGTQSNYGYVPKKRDWADIYTNSNPYGTL